MMRRALGWAQVVGLVGAVACGWAGCSEPEDEQDVARPGLLSVPAGRIAADALSDQPSAEFLAVQQRLDSRVARGATSYARTFRLGAGRGAALVGDPQIAQARSASAAALATTIDPVKVSDVASAQQGLDALLAELTKVSPGAGSCDALLGAKGDRCAFALLIIEVQRSEGIVTALDAGVVTLADGGPGAPVVRADASAATPVTPGKPASTPVVAIECSDRDTTGARVVKDRLAKSETWSGKIVVRGVITVQQGQTLTILPGTQVLMDVDSQLEIGWNSGESTLIADGTPEAPIRFCGVLPEPGSWRNVVVQEHVTSNSVLRHVLIAGGGAEGSALTLNADITVDDVQVKNAKMVGVSATDFRNDSKNLSVSGSGTALVLRGPGAFTRFPLGGSFTDNQENLARVRFADIAVNTVIHNIGVPYLQEAKLDTQSGASLTFEAGVEYRFGADVGLEIGWNSSTAALHVNGTADAPVVFRGGVETAGYWTGLIIGVNTTSDSGLTHTEIRHGGGMGTPLVVNSPIRLDHVTLSDNAKSAFIGEGGLIAGSTHLTITKTTGRPLRVRAPALFTLPEGGAFTGNTVDQIEVTGGSIVLAGTIPNLGVPYYVPTTFDGSNGSSITIAAGTQFVMGADGYIDIGWNSSVSTLIANGTAAAPIRFVGEMPTPGFWRGLFFSTGVRSNSALSYVEISHAGGGTGARRAAVILNTPIPVTNSRFVASAGYGIAKSASNTIDYNLTNTFENMALGAVTPN